MFTPASNTSSQQQERQQPLSPSSSKKTQYASYKLLIASNLFFVLGSTLYLASALLNAQEERILETGGALYFVAVGSLDCRNTQGQMHLHLVLILAGMFGTASAATSQGSEITASIKCNLIASHLLLLESLHSIYGHLHGTQLV
jgi:hypothetical protein